jgi:hypothetical protein
MPTMERREQLVDVGCAHAAERDTRVDAVEERAVHEMAVVVDSDRACVHLDIACEEVHGRRREARARPVYAQAHREHDIAEEHGLFLAQWGGRRFIAH